MEILRDDVSPAFNKVTSQAENSLLDQARKDTFSAKGKISTGSNGSSTFTGSIDGKEQPVNATSSTKEGVDWNLTYYDNTNSIYSQGGASQYKVNMDVVSPMIGKIIGLGGAVAAPYSASITDASGNTKTYDGSCVANAAGNTVFMDCNTAVKDSSGKVIYRLDESETATSSKGGLDYKAVMSDPSGKKLGIVRAGMVKGDSESTYLFDSTVTKF